jgi:SagB-type dehydrogenase family enzyme
MKFGLMILGSLLCFFGPSILCVAGTNQDLHPRIVLPAPRTDGTLSLERAIAGRRSRREPGKGSITLADVGQVCWAAQGITDPPNRRAVPSAGALYPLEVYVVAGNVKSLEAAIYKYLAGEHSIEMVLKGDHRGALAEAALGQTSITHCSAAVVVAGVLERTKAKYGERAERYMNMEAGCVIQNVYLQAESLGLAAVAIGAFDDPAVKNMVKMTHDEQPLIILPLN